MLARTIGRRSVLKAGGALIVAFSLPPIRSARATSYPEVAPGQLDSWLSIDPKGLVTVFTGRIDMGTGVETVYAQGIAEELDVPVSAVKMVMGDTDVTPEQGKSTAANGVVRNLPPLRQAAAEARLVLLEHAADRLGVPLDRLRVQDGIVSAGGDAARTVSYGELIGGQHFAVTLAVDARGDLKGRAKPKDGKQFKVLGTSVPRVDIPSKVSGAAEFVHDVTLDGMLHGTVVLPPARGSVLASVDGLAQPIPGVVKIVTEGNFVGIVAETEQAAVAARKALKVTWKKGPQAADYSDVYGAIRKAEVAETADEYKNGDIAAGLSGAATVLEATYQTPFNSHGMMGPSCAVADWRSDGLTLWSGTQWPDGTRRDVAQMMGMPVEQVRLVWRQSAGSYGRLGVDDAAADAALLSRAVGRPVRVQWQRADEHGWAPLNPAGIITIKAGLDAKGTITAWDYDMLTPSHSASERGNMLAWRLIGTNAGYKRFSGGSDEPPYDFAHTRITTRYTKEILRSVYMRSVAGIQNTFAIESMMDDLAAKAGMDPIEFRLRHIADERMKTVLKAVAAKAGPNPTTPASQRRTQDLVVGRGVAIYGANHPRGGATGAAYVATIVDAEIDRSSGRVYARRVFVGFETGKVMNPDGLRNQIEGGTIMGLSRGLKEEVTLKDDAVTSVDWASYPVLRFSEIPESLEVVVVDTDAVPRGAGEAPNVTPPAALGNAIFAATGVRIRSLPLTPDRVLAALRA